MKKKIKIVESNIKWGNRTTTIRGMENGQNKEVERKLKRICATGGTSDESRIMLQGWHGPTVKTELMKTGISENDIELTRIGT